MREQLALDFRLPDTATFSSFYIADNKELFASVQRAAQVPNTTLIYLWGASGSGCSHLLQAACHTASSSVYLPLKDCLNYGVDILVGLEQTHLVCFDNIEAVSGNMLWQQKIFHLFNALREHGNNIIVASRMSATALELQLADLKSRLAWGASYQIQALTDSDKIAALQLRAQARGLQLDARVGKYLLDRLPRDMSQLFASLELLDKASLVEQRKLSIPFVKTILSGIL
ncbi:MAG: DnaA regulatory inactivator Hda [Legionellales bacterium]|nr:MAG: DnaA regulatory inactivator Hda [Legionellales bacterium]